MCAQALAMQLLSEYCQLFNGSIQWAAITHGTHFERHMCWSSYAFVCVQYSPRLYDEFFAAWIHVSMCVCAQKMLHCNFNSFYCIWVLYCSKSVITNTHAHTTVINDSLHMCIQSERERTAALSTHISMQLLRSISPLRCCCTRNMRTFGILCMIYAAPNICKYVCVGVQLRNRLWIAPTLTYSYISHLLKCSFISFNALHFMYINPHTHTFTRSQMHVVAYGMTSICFSCISIPSTAADVYKVEV